MARRIPETVYRRVPVTQAQINSVKFKNVHMGWFRTKMKWLRDISTLRAIDGYLADCAEIEREWKSWIDSYESYNRDVPRRIILAAFTQHWKRLRLRLPLQDRLVIEQILWDKGAEWRELVTGFRPIKGGRP